MAETIFGKKKCNVYFDFLVWPVSHLLTWRGGFMTYTTASCTVQKAFLYMKLALYRFFSDKTSKPLKYLICFVKLQVVLRRVNTMCVRSNAYFCHCLSLTAS